MKIGFLNYWKFLFLGEALSGITFRGRKRALHYNFFKFRGEYYCIFTHTYKNFWCSHYHIITKFSNFDEMVSYRSFIYHDYEWCIDNSFEVCGVYGWPRWKE